MNVFLSYNWKQQELADAIDTSLRSVGIRVARDIRSSKPWDSLPQFILDSVSQADVVVALISPEYQKSPNCMAEFVLAMKKDVSRLFPITDREYGDLFTDSAWSDVVGFWKNESSKLPNTKTHKVGAEEFPAADQIWVSLPQVHDFLKSTLVPSIVQLQESGYRELLHVLGFDAKQLISELLQTEREADIEQREILLDEFLRAHPDHALAHHVRGGMQTARGDFQRARKSYEAAIELDPEFPDAHNDYALLLENRFDEKQLAESYYQRAIDLDEGFDLAFNNYGCLLESMERYTEAEANFQRALECSPAYTGARMNLATLLAEHMDRPQEARAELETVLKLDDEYADAHLNYAILLADYFGEKDAAEFHRSKSLSLRRVQGESDRGWRP